MKKLWVVAFLFSIAIFQESSAAIETQDTLFEDAFKKGDGARLHQLMQSNKNKWLDLTQNSQEETTKSIKKLLSLSVLGQPLPKRVFSASGEYIFNTIRDEIKSVLEIRDVFITALVECMQRHLNLKSDSTMQTHQILELKTALATTMNILDNQDAVERHIYNLLTHLGQKPLYLLINALYHLNLLDSTKQGLSKKIFLEEAQKNEEFGKSWLYVLAHIDNSSTKNPANYWLAKYYQNKGIYNQAAFFSFSTDSDYVLAKRMIAEQSIQMAHRMQSGCSGKCTCWFLLPKTICSCSCRPEDWCWWGIRSNVREGSKDRINWYWCNCCVCGYGTLSTVDECLVTVEYYLKLIKTKHIVSSTLLATIVSAATTIFTGSTSAAIATLVAALAGGGGALYTDKKEQNEARTDTLSLPQRSVLNSGEQYGGGLTRVSLAGTMDTLTRPSVWPGMFDRQKTNSPPHVYYTQATGREHLSHFPHGGKVKKQRRSLSEEPRNPQHTGRVEMDTDTTDKSSDDIQAEALPIQNRRGPIHESRSLEPIHRQPSAPYFPKNFSAPPERSIHPVINKQPQEITHVTSSQLPTGLSVITQQPTPLESPMRKAPTRLHHGRKNLPELPTSALNQSK